VNPIGQHHHLTWFFSQQFHHPIGKLRRATSLVGTDNYKFPHLGLSYYLKSSLAAVFRPYKILVLPSKHYANGSAEDTPFKEGEAVATPDTNV